MIKFCPQCKKNKVDSEFNKDKNKKDRLNYECRNCSRIRKNNWNKTIDGLISSMYNSQINSYKTRKTRTIGMSALYSKEEFKTWITSKKEFIKLFNNWKHSGYKTELKPSVDRMNPNIGYEFTNMELMTWEDNKHKGYSDIKNGIDKRVIKSVVQYDANMKIINTFHSVSEASRITGVGTGHISKVCLKRYGFKSAGGFIWEYK